MKFSAVSAVLGSAVFLSAPALGSHHSHHSHAQRHAHGPPHHHQAKDLSVVSRRDGQCTFPTDDPNLVAITLDAENAGWAMSPDQPCLPGNWCPYACKPGMVMAQWDPKSTFTYPASMNGGLYCDKSGKMVKPFPSKPYCVKGTGTVKAVNKCKGKMSWCQTVLPGNEAMLIPTLVESVAVLAVPNRDYWQGTAAHFYLNPPGVGEEGCIWGDDQSPIGNWSPYVAGANTDGNGNTFVKIGWNPIWEDSGLKSKLPDFGLKIECPNGGCVGLPCSIDPGSGSGSVDSSLSAKGAGGSSFCVVTVSKGSEANIVAYSLGGGSGSNGDDKEEPKPKPTSTPKPEPTTSAAPTTSSKETTTSTTPTPDPTTSTSEIESTSTSTSSVKSTSSEEPTSTYAESTFVTPATTPKGTPTVEPGVFHENGTSTTDSKGHTSTGANVNGNGNGNEVETDAPPADSDDKDGAAVRRSGNAALSGLVVAFIAAVCFF